MKKFLSPQQFKLSKADLAPQKEISESPEDETQSDMEKLQVPISDHSVGRATDELGEPAKRLENKSSSPESKFSLSDLFSNKSQFSTRQLTQASQTPNNRKTSPSSAPRGKSEKRLCRQTATRASSPA